MTVTREIAITETWLDSRARLEGPSVPEVRTYDRVGQASFVIGVLMLVILYWRAL